MTINKDVEPVLAARRYLYTLFQSLFGNEPSCEQFAAIDPALIEEALTIALEADLARPTEPGEPGECAEPGEPSECAEPGEPGECAEPGGPGESDRPAEPAASITDFIELLAQYKTQPEALKSEYTRLFIGPGKLAAPPWESVYRTKERSLFTRITLEVRSFYRSQGFIPELYPSVADDHISLEFDFLARLAAAALDAYILEAQAEPSGTDCQEALAASRDFLREHLLTWFDEYVGDLQAQQEARFYPHTALIAKLFVEADAKWLEGMLNLKEI